MVEAVCGRQSVNIAVIIITACRRVHAAERKHTMKTTKSLHGTGFTLVEIMIVVAISACWRRLRFPTL